MPYPHNPAYAPPGEGTHPARVPGGWRKDPVDHDSRQFGHLGVDMSFTNASSLQGWVVEKDTVSQGSSSASLKHLDGGKNSAPHSYMGYAQLKGTLSQAGWGDAYCFAFKRFEAPHDFSRSTLIKFLCRGDGGEYALLLRCDQSTGGPIYKATFRPKDYWDTIAIPIKSFVPTRTGHQLEINGWAGPPFRKMPLGAAWQIGVGVQRERPQFPSPFCIEWKRMLTNQPVDIERASAITEAAMDLEYMIRVKSHVQFKDMHEAFLQYDKDRSGTLDREELRGVCEKFNIGAGDPRVVQELLDRCDADGDGKVSYVEFSEHLGSHIRDAEGDVHTDPFKSSWGSAAVSAHEAEHYQKDAYHTSGMSWEPLAHTLDDQTEDVQAKSGYEFVHNT